MKYTVNENQLVRLHYGVQESAWFLPETGTVISVHTDDLGGHCFADVVVLSDDSVVIVPDDDSLDARLYPSLQAAHFCGPCIYLERQN